MLCSRPGICGQPSIPAVNETVDDLLIFAEVRAIDGVGGILGAAGPCLIRVANGLTIIGYMEFDEADLVDLAAFGHLEDVVLHEMAHVLGLGTLSPWDNQLVGAGGGGFLLFYAERDRALREAMRKAGLQELRFRFDFEGTKVLFS